MLAEGFEAYKASLSTILTDLFCLQVDQMPRSPDLAIFVRIMTEDRQN